MNVLILAEDFYPTKAGGAFVDWNVARHLHEEGDEVTVVTARNGEMASSEIVEGVEIRRPFRGVPENTPQNSLRGILRRLLFFVLVVPYLVVLARRVEFDVIYSTNFLFHPPATLVSTIFQTVHLSFVGYSPSIQDDATLFDPLVVLERINFRLFMGDRALCQTPSVYDLLVKRSGAEVERIDGSIDSDAINAAVNSNIQVDIQLRTESGTHLVFVGRLSELKNAEELPNVIAQLPPEYSLVIVGDGPQREFVESAVERAEVEDRVQLVGQLPHEDTLRVIHESDHLVLPSEADAYPAVVFESLALKTPVLATPVGVLPEINHPKLTTAPLEKFNDILSNIDIETEEGIDEKTLQRFSVDRLSRDVRRNMLAAASIDD